MAYLQILNGARELQVEELNPSASLVVGSGYEGLIRLTDTGVEGRHCQVYPAQNAYWLQDLGAGNTILHMKRLKQTTEGLKQGDDEWELEKRLDSMHELLVSIQSNARPKRIQDLLWKDPASLDDTERRRAEEARHLIWKRHDPKISFTDGLDSDHMPSVFKDDLKADCAIYLERPWLRHPVLDWMLVDMLVTAETALFVPFFKAVAVPMSAAAYVALTYFVIVGSSNAVNLTDGLDGLAIMPCVMVAGGLGVFAYVTGHANFSAYLQIPNAPGAGEMLIFCATIVGAGLGFLWFNTYPAQVFMGDIGALALGAALGVVAVIVRQEIVLAVMGGLFVLETVSGILQVASVRLRGKRIFRMAPIHHHYELKGWAEPKVIVRFWIISFMLVLVGLATLKLR